MILPDYAGGGIANLMRSLAEACGAPLPIQPPLAGLDSAELAAAPRLVLLVIDGLGWELLTTAAGGGALAGHLCGRLSSVFPSTTASAVTTFLTGLTPAWHALTGWHMYFAEIDRIAAVLPLTPRGGGRFEADPGTLPRLLFGHASFFEGMARRPVLVYPQHIIDSEFSVHHAGPATRRGYRNLDEMFARIEEAIAEGGRSYIHAYFPDLDSEAHRHGVGSPQVAALLAALDHAFARFLDRIRGSDTLVLATADHGFIDSPPERVVDLADHPALAVMLVRPLCGERRVAYCYVRPECGDAFMPAVRAELGHCAEVFPAAALIAGGWFGPGPVHPRLASRVGDYVLVMKEDWTLVDWMPDEKRYVLTGVHGGTSVAEMFVPLVLARP